MNRFFFILLLVSLPCWARISTESKRAQSVSPVSASQVDSIPIELAPSDKAIYQKVRKVLKGKLDFIKQEVKRSETKENTLEIESFISTEGSLKWVAKILTDFSQFERWAMKDINVRPSGGTYFVQLEKITFEKARPMEPILSFAVRLPIYNKEGKRRFNVTVDEKPNVVTLNAVAIKKESAIVKRISSTFKFFPSEDDPNRIWVHLTGDCWVNWLVFQVLPEKRLNRDTRERVERILENYLQEEDRQRELEEKRQLSKSKSAQM